MPWSFEIQISLSQQWCWIHLFCIVNKQKIYSYYIDVDSRRSANQYDYLIHQKCYRCYDTCSVIQIGLSKTYSGPRYLFRPQPAPSVLSGVTSVTDNTYPVIQIALNKAYPASRYLFRPHPATNVLSGVTLCYKPFSLVRMIVRDKSTFSNLA